MAEMKYKKQENGSVSGSGRICGSRHRNSVRCRLRYRCLVVVLHALPFCSPFLPIRVPPVVVSNKQESDAVEISRFSSICMSTLRRRSHGERFRSGYRRGLHWTFGEDRGGRELLSARGSPGHDGNADRPRGLNWQGEGGMGEGIGDLWALSTRSRGAGQSARRRSPRQGQHPVQPRSLDWQDREHNGGQGIYYLLYER